MTYFWSQTLFTVVIQKSMEKFYLCFVEGIRVKITSGLADKNTSSLQCLYWVFIIFKILYKLSYCMLQFLPVIVAIFASKLIFVLVLPPKFPCTVIPNQLTGLS